MSDPPKLKVADGPKRTSHLFDGQGYTAAWLSKQDLPPTRFAIPHIIPEGVTLLAGAPKIGKSWLTLSICLAIGHGTKVFGCLDVEQRPVLLLALEDGQKSIDERLLKLTGGKDAYNCDQITIFNRVDTSRIIHDMKMWLYEHYSLDKPPIIILDTLVRGMPQGSPNKTLYQNDSETGFLLKSVTDDYPGTSLLCIHHNRKGESDDPMDMVSGSKGLTGAVDTIITLERPRLQPEATLHVFSRLMADGKYSMRLDDCLWTLSDPTLEASASRAARAEGQVQYGDRRKDIMDFVWQEGSVTAKDVRDKFGPGSDVYLKRLVESENIIKAARGTYSAPVRKHNAG